MVVRSPTVRTLFSCLSGNVLGLWLLALVWRILVVPGGVVLWVLVQGVCLSQAAR